MMAGARQPLLSLPFFSCVSFQARAELGAALLGGRAPLFSRLHFRVFGGRVAERGAAWARAVYGPELVWNAPLLSLRGAAEGGNATATEAADWRRFLCREKQWARYCGAEDAAFFAAQPPPHAGVALSRGELEAMEAAAKARRGACLVCSWL